MKKSEKIVIQTATQVFDVEIAETMFDGYQEGMQVPGLFIAVNVGDDPVRNHGYQSFSLAIPHDANLSLILRDWADLIQELPDAIMQFHL